MALTTVPQAMLTLPLTAGTAIASTSGTSIDFTGIPAGVKRITVTFSGVSTSGTSLPLIQLGAGTVATTGYVSVTSVLYPSATNNASASTAGIGIFSNQAASILYGQVIFSNNSGNAWVASGNLAASSGPYHIMTAGGVTLGGALDRVRITTTNGTDTFDAGSVNILWE